MSRVIDTADECFQTFALGVCLFIIGFTVRLYCDAVITIDDCRPNVVCELEIGYR